MMLSFPSPEAYIFWWLLLPVLFFPFYFVPFFLKRYRYVLIYCTTVAVIALALLYQFRHSYQGSELMLYTVSAAVFSGIIRCIQLFWKNQRKKIATIGAIIFYGILPLSGGLFWPVYLVGVPLWESWENRPDKDCIAKGRLISLEPGVIYRLHPVYGDDFWIERDGETFNVSSRKFCQSFSADTVSPIDKLEFSFYELCRSPQTPWQKAYCAGNSQSLRLSNLILKRSASDNESGWQQLQEELNGSRNIQRLQGQLPYSSYYYTDWLQTVQFDSGVTTYEFYRSGVSTVVKHPDWLHQQPEPVVLNCSQEYYVRCNTAYLYRDDLHIRYSYNRAKDNQRYDFDEDVRHIYDSNYINTQLNAAREAASIAEKFLEEMRVY
ncbi:hypothetical protein [Limnobaculum xujianqingii]|uniref:hypothetical protein n=1 Tax=Limnobaculum xujianqingii TaxID=2738837 RepID=UPI001E37A69D|nr:hypothetical protein [Limnobaculum xujianqingii]